jgi:glutathione S-transferase
LQYLEAKHPRGSLLFPNSAVKAYAASLNEFGKLLAPHIGALTIPHIAQKLDEHSREYFIESKIGQARFGRLSGLGEEEKDAHVQSAKKMLGIVESSLACEAAKADAQNVQSGGKRWLAGTELPSHADVS